jgi:hypothetical protein
MEYEKSKALALEAERALELVGRAIRMAGYQNYKLDQLAINGKTQAPLMIAKDSGYRGSDSLVVRHGLSDGIDFDCIGNVLSSERTKHHLAFQGFMVDRQAGLPKGVKTNGGSLICQSLDRQGRIQNTTLMNGVNVFKVEEVGVASHMGQRAFRVKLEMTDGALIEKGFERVFTTRNLP